MIQPIGSMYADAYYSLRNFYPYRRDPPADSAAAANKTTVTDVVELSAEAQEFLDASRQSNN